MNNIVVPSSRKDLGLVPTGLYSTPKDKFIESRRQIISKMKKEIAETEAGMVAMDTASFEYKRFEKRIEKCREIIKNCEQAIYITKVQMNLPTNASYRGL